MSFSQLPAVKKTSFLVGISNKFRPFLFCYGFSNFVNIFQHRPGIWFKKKHYRATYIQWLCATVPSIGKTLTALLSSPNRVFLPRTCFDVNEMGEKHTTIGWNNFWKFSLCTALVLTGKYTISNSAFMNPLMFIATQNKINFSIPMTREGIKVTPWYTRKT